VALGSAKSWCKRVAAALGSATSRIGSITLALHATKSTAHSDTALGLNATNLTEDKKLTCMMKLLDKDKTHETLRFMGLRRFLTSSEQSTIHSCELVLMFCHAATATAISYWAKVAEPMSCAVSVLSIVPSGDQAVTKLGRRGD
jgi:hypothetical protein